MPAETRPLSGDIQEIIIPFKFFSQREIDLLDPLDGEGDLMRIATGKEVHRERRPYDPVTAWITLAFLGLLEEGHGPLPLHLNREQRLEAARKVLTEDELVQVETIAVPMRYRELPAATLAEMVQNAPDYIDRMWAACWLILVGWTDSSECSFRKRSELPDNSMGEPDELVVEGFAASIGVTSRDDVLGWRRVDGTYEANLVSRRITICEMHYELNGPPPYECMKAAVPLTPAWKQTVRVIPS